MTPMFHELLLSELRMVVYQPGDPADVTDERLCEAVTLNENIRSLGFVLRPDDVLRLSASASLHGFFSHLESLVPDVKAEPMYPGFPQQVMEMSEAQFRLHQIIHYFSTYGLEDLLGETVQRGWLPASSQKIRSKADSVLLESRVIELVAGAEAPIAVLRALLNRRERLTNPELDLVLECAPLCTAEQLQGLCVRFKENLDLLFPMLTACPDRGAALRTLRAVCAHSGDVLTCAKNLLREKKYHLRTSEKKLLVKLLEAYPVGDLRRNLMQSLRLRERNLQVLQHLDYNRFSRSEAHSSAVSALRNGELLSWHGVGEALLASRSPEALTHLAQRPGYMVRMLSRLPSLDYSEEAIIAALTPRSGAVSGHLVVKTLRTMLRRSIELGSRHKQAVRDCEEKYCDEIAAIPDNSWEKRSLAHRAHMRRDMAKRFWLEEPEERLREECFWQVTDLEKEIQTKEKEAAQQAKTIRRLETLSAPGSREYLHQNANHELDAELLQFRLYPDFIDRLRTALDGLQAETAHLKQELKQVRLSAEERFGRRLAKLLPQCRQQYQERLAEIDAWEQEESVRLQKRFEAAQADYDARMRTLPQRKAAELAQLEERYQHELKASRHDAAAAGILKKLLHAHFAKADTPLRGKKVFFDMDAFDLEHSVLETEDRSKDGGFIRSGIAYRIPADAKVVRFFVYWNDRQRVDVDLHAGGITTDGADLHIGWNSDFRRDGVVHSGDITHSDAAEYIDVDLSAPIREIYTNVHQYSGRDSFRKIETCFVGMMAVKENGEQIRHYNPANCFFTHRLTQKTNCLYYGFIDVQNRFVRFVGQENESGWASRPSIESEQTLYSLREYLDCVLDAQGAEKADTPQKADVVLTMGKSLRANAVSLADSNFFLEC